VVGKDLGRLVFCRVLLTGAGGVEVVMCVV
jgi:hypothetical protein